MIEKASPDASTSLKGGALLHIRGNRPRHQPLRLVAPGGRWRDAARGLAGAAAGHAWIYGLMAGARLYALTDWLQPARVKPHAWVMRASGPRTRLRLVVGVATAGRPDMARETVSRIARQSRPPDAIVVSVPTLADIGADIGAAPGLAVLVGARGLTRQRNAILAQMGDADIVCFFDDDFVLGADYLAAIERAFLADPTLAGVTGSVLADGITGPGLSLSEADGLLAAGSAPVSGLACAPVYNAYGCNMAFRVAAIRAGNLRFDERLPRYGWLEDVDFSRRIAAFGPLARVGAAMGVHLGVKGGRQSGLCFGYSQIANPIHLVRKGSYAWPRAAWLMSRNVAMNALRAMRPEPYVDRRGRVAGNVAALRDLFGGRLSPERIESLS